MIRDDLGTRMKNYYENISKTKLMRRTPVAIRIDGKAFHSFTKGFNKPFDFILSKAMQETMKHLCENIQGCVLGYTQSDEITLILIDYQTLETSAWFDYEIQKMCSIAASMATMAFNRIFSDKVKDEILRYNTSLGPQDMEDREKIYKYHEALEKAIQKGAMFDARCFNIPKEEVTNLIYWRQLDAMRNSIQMAGQTYFSHKELQGKSCNDIKNMLLEQKHVDWETDYTTRFKCGSCCIKAELTGTNTHRYWKIDNEIPIFKGEGREYIDKLVDI